MDHSMTREERFAAFDREEGVVLNLLAEQGFAIARLADLLKVDISKPLAEALLAILPHAVWWKGTIVRALRDPAAKGIAAQPLIDEFLNVEFDINTPRERYVDPDGVVRFKAIPNESYKWAIGNSLYVVATKEHLDQLLTIALDESHGTTRDEIVRSLARFKKDPRVTPTLLRLLYDDDVVIEALEALRRIKAEGARKRAEELLSHNHPLVRKEAEKLLKVLDREAG